MVYVWYMCVCMVYVWYMYLVGVFLGVATYPSEKDELVKVSWDDEIPN